MSTPNFCKRNASKFFMAELENDFDADDLMDNTRLELTGYNAVHKFDNDRNYSGLIYGEKTIQRGIYIITYQLIIRSGYYVGANLDWDVKIIKDTLKDYAEIDWGYQDDGDLPNYILSLINKEIERIEKVFNDFTTALICRGIFSNGEAVYALANEKQAA